MIGPDLDNTLQIRRCLRRLLPKVHKDGEATQGWIAKFLTLGVELCFDYKSEVQR